MRPTVKEEVEWINKDQVKVVIKTEMPVMDGDEKVGNDVRVQTIDKATFKHMQDGANTYKDLIQKGEVEIKKIEDEIAAMGEVQKMNPHLKRLAKDFENIMKIRTLEESKVKLAPLKEELKYNKELLKDRQILIETRPKE